MKPALALSTHSRKLEPRAHAGHELTGGERFDEAIVCACLEPGKAARFPGGLQAEALAGYRFPESLRSEHQLA
jgi:hypothetical protein